MDTLLNKIDNFSKGRINPEELMDILTEIAVNPDAQESLVNERRSAYISEQLEDYGSFIPASSVAADDGHNLCDFQCETFILRKEGINIDDEYLASLSRRNYWLLSQGTPLFNMGRLMEKHGLLVKRDFNVDLDKLESLLLDHNVIVVVNGDTLLEKEIDILSDNFDLNDNPNHAIVVTAVSREHNYVEIYNPATDEMGNTSQYPLEIFVAAWAESKNYTVTARPKKVPYEYCPQPIDVSSVSINPELMELIELIAENAHDVWAVDKMKAGFSYAPTDQEGKEQSGKHNHYLLPYEMLEEADKEPDRKMAMQTIKLVKRLGYRLVNINSMYKCPVCGEIIEPSHNFCCNCGNELSWEDFK